MAATFQTSFAGALLNAGASVPAEVTAHNAAVPARRFAVYRNNVLASLTQALQRRFPVVEKLVGTEFFVRMAREFVVAQPPRSPLLVTYGDELAGFIAAFEPARELPYLADVARLEAARTRAYHAADATPMRADEFSALDPDALSGLRIALHPSVEVVRSSYPIVTIWAMNSGELSLGPIADFRGEDALVARPHLDVEVRALPPGGAACLGALAAGQPLGTAAEAGLADDRHFDLTQNLAGLIGSGIVRGVTAPAPKNARLP